MSKDDTFPPEKCCFCEKPFEKPDFGCNPYPLADAGRCCNFCDSVLVNTARMLPQFVGSSQSAKVVGLMKSMIWAHKEAEKMKKELMKNV
tara:strand:- start:4961 stop:5230 length:270 start_codon:yes stop_codon:yes gene_type:complete